jgi:hypothetical protein
MANGRPRKPKYTIKTMVRKIYEYTEKTQLPILKECCFQNDWNYDYVMQLQRDNPVLSQSIRRLLTKKEIILEKGLYAGANNTGFVFGLKQLGWKDSPEPLVVNNTIQNNTGGNRSEKLNRVSTEILEEIEDLLNTEEEEDNGS